MGVALKLTIPMWTLLQSAVVDCRDSRGIRVVKDLGVVLRLIYIAWLSLPIPTSSRTHPGR